jgi:uncharacterized membrane protein YdjX (TVP38/TMEM64 family)
MRGRRALLVLLGLLLFGAMAMVFFPAGRALLGGGVAWLRDGGPTGQLVALAMVVVGIPLGLPTLWFAALLGYLFGVGAGVPLALVATLCGATMAFSVARWLMLDDIARLVARRERSRALVAAVGAGGVPLVVLIRLIGPHNLLNLSLAASPLPLAHFVLGTAIGGAPTVSLAAVGGALAPDAAALWQAREAVGLAWVPIVVLGLAGMIAAVVMVRRATAAALARHAVEIRPAPDAP